MNVNSEEELAGFPAAKLENWYRHNYFNNDIDISGSGVEEYTYREVQDIAGFTFDELDDAKITDAETIGRLSIREILAERFGSGQPDKVMVTNGGNEALHLIAHSILKPGDEIVSLGPCYHCHDKIALSIGCDVKYWNLDPAKNFDLNIDDLASLLSSKTKALFFNFPHNPSGKSISQAMLNKIVDLASKVGLYLVWDAVFQELTYDNPPLIDPTVDYDKAITLGTFSKAYGAPGLRFGWIIASQQIIQSCVRQKDYGNLFVAPLIEFVAEKILSKLDDFSRPRIIQAKENRAYVDDWLSHHDFGMHWYLPDGGVCGAVKLPDGVDDIVFCTQLLAQEKVLLVPGTCFDMPGYVRLGFGGNSKALQDGLQRLEHFL